MIINPESLNNNYYICNKRVANYLGKKGEIFLSVIGRKYYFVINDHLNHVLKKNIVYIKLLEVF